MSSTPKAADDIKKLLDRGMMVQLWANPMGSYTAVALTPFDQFDPESLGDGIEEDCITDDFEPSQALYRLAEKVMRTGDYSE